MILIVTTSTFPETHQTKNLGVIPLSDRLLEEYSMTTTADCIHVNIPIKFGYISQIVSSLLLNLFQLVSFISYTVSFMTFGRLGTILNVVYKIIVIKESRRRCKVM
ncbi:uncharacterized protein EV154DRAFT_485510 [Mucor mucedo]|uniref:uncharacterized protein n=1 Tax=Mucor mucedo TaxID=29922 RepID=UPI00221F2279|nr:uncharacterized protein EV154DRAFT_485510 [Mucor mucedo]KAI7883840.1 hypothetical protein EV154DRAFT_485510 [Mucor mucedo]